MTNRAAFASIVRKQHWLHALIWALNSVLGYLYSDSTGICSHFFLLILYSFGGKKVSPNCSVIVSVTESWSWTVSAAVLTRGYSCF